MRIRGARIRAYTVCRNAADSNRPGNSQSAKTAASNWANYLGYLRGFSVNEMGLLLKNSLRASFLGGMQATQNYVMDLSHAQNHIFTFLLALLKRTYLIFNPNPRDARKSTSLW